MTAPDLPPDTSDSSQSDGQPPEPFLVRQGLAERDDFNGPFEGVPDHLWPSLWELTQSVLFSSTEPYRVKMHEGQGWLMRVERRLLRQPLGIDRDWTDARILEHFETRFRAEPSLHLAMLEAGLQVVDPYPDRLIDILVDVLEEAGSIWTVRRLNGEVCLVRRVSPQIETLVAASEDTGQQAGQLLASAWTQAFGRRPHASDAYRQAVRAIEAAAGPILLPNDPDGRTLGKMIGHLNQAPHKWRFVLEGHSDPEKTVVPVRKTMAML